MYYDLLINKNKNEKNNWLVESLKYLGHNLTI